MTLYFAFQNLRLEMASYPTLTVLMECVVYRRMPPLRQLAGIFIAVAGVGLLTGAATSDGARTALGNWLLIATGFSWGFYSLLTQKAAARYPTSMLTAWQMLFGALFFVPFATFEGKPWLMPTAASTAVISFWLCAVRCCRSCSTATR